jgi:60 kDa SS-A/Ro ribonucleoprotein
MTNLNLFTTKSHKAQPTNAVNNAGGKAYAFDPKHCLAQIAVTNCFNGTFYATAETNLKLAKDAALQLKNDPEFIAKVAVYARDKAYMKDMPAFLTVLLSDIDKPLFRKVFRRVVDNGKMLRNVVQMARSGAVTGRKINVSAGTWRHAIQEWFNDQSAWGIFKASIGNNPTLYDILRMAHPKPNTPEKAALFSYIAGREFDSTMLPEQVRQLEEFKKNPIGEVPDVDFRFLDSLGLGQQQWTNIAMNASWHMTRMNLATFARHGVFENANAVAAVAERISDRELIQKVRVFPYQLFAAWRQIHDQTNVPEQVKRALNNAMEIAIGNVPLFPGKGLVCVDASGSMAGSITGFSRSRHSSKISCSDVAGLVASAIARKNSTAEIWTFSDGALRVHLNSSDSVFQNTQKLNNAGGGTNISAPMREFNYQSMKADWVLYVSDNESWLDSVHYGYRGTALAEEWAVFKERNPKAKLVCCDLTPRNNSQIDRQPDVLQVGGFSDQVFEVISSFLGQKDSDNHWVEAIEKICFE